MEYSTVEEEITGVFNRRSVVDQQSTVTEENNETTLLAPVTYDSHVRIQARMFELS